MSRHLAIKMMTVPSEQYSRYGGVGWGVQSRYGGVGWGCTVGMGGGVGVQLSPHPPNAGLTNV